MKNLSAYASLLLLATFLMTSNCAFSQKTDPAKWDRKTADKWVKSKVWAPSLKPNADPSVNSREFARQYYANKAGWDKAFAFLQRPDLATLAPGKYPLDGNNVYATISDDPLKELSQSNWEDHHNYIDLHYVIEGKEKIGGTLFTNVKNNIVTPFDETKDIGYYKYNGGNYYTATPNNFFLFFPAEAHRPHLKLPGYTKAKKVVIKIRVAK